MLTCIPDVLEPRELKRIRGIIAEARFADGRKTAGHRAKRVKHNLQLSQDGAEYAEIDRLIRQALWRKPAFQRAALPRRIRPFLVSCYHQGMEYGRHVDDALMGNGDISRADVSVTVFLSDPASYEGGELVITSHFGTQEVKLPACAAVVYPCWHLHRVAPVSRGERLVAVTWVQSHVRDGARRELLHDLAVVRDELAASAPAAETTDLAFKSYSNLLRMWSEL